VRLLPPLIIGAPEIAQAIESLDRAATRLEQAAQEKQKTERAAE
jgi:acetylornithine/succinyldiaminopimelate/putrescine aminotransferase